jgi:hypothetical protein
MSSMKGTSNVAALTAILGFACGAGDTRLDPGDLELRDLLGIAPKVANGWDAEQRASARRVLATGLDEDAIPTRIALSNGRDLDERVSRSIAALDRERVAEGSGALGVVRVAIDPEQLTAVGFAAPHTAQLTATGTKPAASGIELRLGEDWQAPANVTWSHLPGRGVELLHAIALDAGHASGEIIVVPAPRLAAIAAYIEARDATKPRLVVNPVMLAALEPLAGERVTAAGIARVPVSPSIAGATTTASTGTTRGTPAPVARESEPDPNAGNPYSFYGSVAECAYAERTRCESCLPAGNCEAVTDADGNTECEALAMNNGRGYFLLCANLSLAITSVNGCTGRAAAGCPRDPDAASSLDQLENNARFIDDAVCSAALDGCLAEIFGSGGTFPGLDGGVDPPDPPRSTEVSCNDSCKSDDNSNCDTTASCGDCSGVSCGNSFSCDSACSSSNDQSGCGGNCDACESESGGGGGTCGDDGGGGGGGCGGDGTNGESGCGGGNDSGDSGCGGGGDSGGCNGDSSGGGGCGGGESGGGGCGSSDSGGGGGCGGDSGSGGGGGCGDSGGGSGGGGCSGGGGGGGGNSSGCNAARREPGHGLVLAISLVWIVLPVPFAAFVRRRERKRKQTQVVATEDVP